ncbi:M23 family metallopeptidase [Marivirga sp. S37H4]|uniref:M23 family metallopeptidase n=1 Tax=Marivirga aurantiaca TaxID=2802615 RepID=A0A935C809_9BACT|nr:M23 family metallopeptidase [Marivirga aurantiaca]MBK6265240.1 M23 family metallopeptidase [Marivirga aurantiaca]
MILLKARTANNALLLINYFLGIKVMLYSQALHGISMRIYFIILFLIISLSCNGQTNENDSLIKEYNKLSHEIDNIERILMELSRKDDSIYNLIRRKETRVNKINPDFNYSEYKAAYTLFIQKYQNYIKNGNFPSSIPVDISDMRQIIGYGEKIHPILISTRFHTGIDIPSPKGIQIKSTINGEVEAIKNDFGGFGKHIIIKNSQDIEILYAHLDSIYLKEGHKIKIGEVIGTVGSSGSTTATGLHYEIRVNDKHINPIFTFSESLSEEDLKYIWDVKEQSLD